MNECKPWWHVKQRPRFSRRAAARASRRGNQTTATPGRKSAIEKLAQIAKKTHRNAGTANSCMSGPMGQRNRWDSLLSSQEPCLCSAVHACTVRYSAIEAVLSLTGGRVILSLLGCSEPLSRATTLTISGLLLVRFYAYGVRDIRRRKGIVCYAAPTKYYQAQF